MDEQQEQHAALRTEAAKDYLDLIRATINALTWVALCVGACFVLFRASSENNGNNVVSTLAGVAMFVAGITSLGSLYSLAIVAEATRVKWRGRGPRIIRFLLHYHAAVWMVFLGIAIIAVIATPMISRLYPAGG